MEGQAGGRGSSFWDLAWCLAGTEGDGVWLGTLAEVVSRQGTRGLAHGEQGAGCSGRREAWSGKSFTLGVIAEGCQPRGQRNRAARAARAVLLFDPLDVYWTTRYAVAPS